MKYKMTDTTEINNTTLNEDDSAVISSEVEVFGNPQVYGDAPIFGNPQVYGDAPIFGKF